MLASSLPVARSSRKQSNEMNWVVASATGSAIPKNDSTKSGHESLNEAVRIIS